MDVFWYSCPRIMGIYQDQPRSLAGWPNSHPLSHQPEERDMLGTTSSEKCLSLLSTHTRPWRYHDFLAKGSLTLTNSWNPERCRKTVTPILRSSLSQEPAVTPYCPSHQILFLSLAFGIFSYLVHFKIKLRSSGMRMGG